MAEAVKKTHFHAKEHHIVLRRFALLSLIFFQLFDLGVHAIIISILSPSSMKVLHGSTVRLQWHFSYPNDHLHYVQLLYGTTIDDRGFIQNDIYVCQLWHPNGWQVCKDDINLLTLRQRITVLLENVNVNITGYYAVEIEDGPFDIDKSKGIHLIVSGRPVNTSLESNPQKTEVAFGENITLTCSTVAGFPPQFTFFLNDNPLVTNENGVLQIKKITHLHEGNYSCKATNKDGSETSNTLVLIVIKVAHETRSICNCQELSLGGWKAAVAILSILVIGLVAVILYIFLRPRLMVLMRRHEGGDTGIHVTNEHTEIQNEQQYANIETLAMQKAEDVQVTAPQYDCVNAYDSSPTNIPSSARGYQELQVHLQNRKFPYISMEVAVVEW